jgi:hypothetical protein
VVIGKRGVARIQCTVVSGFQLHTGSRPVSLSSGRAAGGFVDFLSANNRSLQVCDSSKKKC